MKIALPAAAAALFLMPLVAQTTSPATAMPVSENTAANSASATPVVAVNPSAHTSLTSNVMEALTGNPALSSVAITVNVTDNGVVLLNGVVPTQEDVNQAIATVKSVSGVKTVKSDLLVSQDPFAAAAAPATPAPAAAPAPAEPGDNAQAVVSKALSANPALSRVGATVYGNTVIVYGTVASGQAHAEAVQIVRRTLPKYQVQDIIYTSSKPAGPAPLLPPV